ncbi:MAG: hypothetical protein A2521_02290 [Deltaproteobacteria bacterium RIFOXYD12_FULL_57_12]|nr:MAG: hypothetical protein A2521_02290 [Deltaproteobacteria bacterium RIFOXYD12_FULL_57_12]
MNGTQMTMRGCQYSPFLFYHHGHTWALVEENAYIRIGIDDLGQKLLGRIEEISLPGKGDQLDGGHGIRVKSRRKTISLIAPVEGNVIKINSNLSMEPLLVNISPYGSGWLALLKPINLKKTIRQLLYGTDALNWFDDETIRLNNMFLKSVETVLPEVGVTLQDGGELNFELLDRMPTGQRQGIIAYFLS